MKLLIRSRLMMKTLVASALLLGSAYVQAEIAVVVHPSNTSEFSAADISRIYLGKLKSFPSGGTVVALDQPEGSPVREANPQ